jgi:hypothetical protein
MSARSTARPLVGSPPRCGSAGSRRTAADQADGLVGTEMLLRGGAQLGADGQAGVAHDLGDAAAGVALAHLDPIEPRKSFSHAHPLVVEKVKRPAGLLCPFCGAKMKLVREPKFTASCPRCDSK